MSYFIDCYFSNDELIGFQEELLTFGGRYNDVMADLSRLFCKALIDKIKMRPVFDGLFVKIRSMNSKLCDAINIVVKHIDNLMRITSALDNEYVCESQDDRTIKIFCDKIEYNNELPSHDTLISCLEDLIEGLKTYNSFILLIQDSEKRFSHFFHDYTVLESLLDSIRANEDVNREIAELINLLEDKKWDIIPLAPLTNF